MEFGYGVWIILGIYFLMLFLILGYASRAKWKSSVQWSDALQQHYLARRTLGFVVLGLSLSASLFSGYSVVGIPAEAYKTGFSAVRWIGSCTYIALVLFMYSPRMHWRSKKFGYVSVVDYLCHRFDIKDRRKSPMHWLFVVILLVPCFVYLLAQFNAFASTMKALSNGVLPVWAGALILGVLLMLYEIVGGLRVIAYTDVLQGSILILGSIMIFVFQKTVFGGLPGISAKLQETHPDRVNVLSSNLIMGWADFWVSVGLQRAMFPDFMTRVMAARGQTSQRGGMVIVLIAPFLIQLPLTILGVIGINAHPGAEPNSVFSLVISDIINHDTFGYIIGSITLAANVAAIMSTGDSVLIVTSQLFAMDVVRPIFFADLIKSGDKGIRPVEGDSATLDSMGISPGGEGEGGSDKPADDKEDTALTKESQQIKKLVWVARVTTVLTVGVCIPIASVSMDLSLMIQFQAAFLAQTFNVYILSQYWKGETWLGSMLGLIVGVSIGVTTQVLSIPLGIIYSVTANLVVTVVVSLLHKKLGNLDGVSWLTRPDYEDAPKVEPMQKPLTILAVVVVSVFAMPFYRVLGSPDLHIGGFPLWCCVALIVLAVAHLMQMVIARLWWHPPPVGDNLPEEPAETGEKEKAADASAPVPV